MNVDLNWYSFIFLDFGIELKCNFELEFVHKIIFLITVRVQMEDGRFLEFIYFNSFMISVNFSDQLVIDMSELVLKKLSSLEMVQ